LFVFIGIAFCFVHREHQVLRRENIIQLAFGQYTSLQYHFPHALTGCGADLADDIAIMVADIRVEVGDNTDGIKHVGFAHRFVGGNAIDAFFQQVVAGVGQYMNGLKHRLADDRFHHVQLELARFRSHRHRNIVADDLEAHLIDDLRDDRVNLGRHD